ncbi:MULTISPECIES: ABC transporter ATP-binding protein [unclassified Ensifer]|uniref:dipeptide ABC transporter ATP-binding protein n=1 Tax=unclassified Ensifer TaxID=2633371 RepID=UPI000813A68E|nr:MULTISPECIES: ABC transporter ATP-binding protein [unclassified Ensifer]OCP19929.1 microcin ABC transporter ATP-binding protein [Ensifer sp. LC54]OCP21113.1 microcin ABC transporter ATP-binding protein [Ensifer sp. LC384]
MTQPLLQIRNLSVALPKGADRPFAVHDVSLEVRPAEILCVVGESGSGKSVLTAALMGAAPKGLRVAAGGALMGGRDLLTLSERQWRDIRGKDIGMIFQEPMASLNPALTVAQQIEEVFELHSDYSRAERAARARKLVEEMHLPEPDSILKSFPHQLSGGQCQRVVIAMALAMNPKLLIADEPTTALDVTTQAQVLKLIRELRDNHGHGIIFITHDLGVVADIADRIAVMRRGEVVEVGSAKQVLTSPQHDYTRALIAAVPSLVPHDRPSAGTEAPALEVTGLNHCYGVKQVLHDIALSVAPGRVLSIVGESGSGKSTIAKNLIRLTDPTSGTISVAGQAMLDLKGGALRRMRRRIQMIFQDPFGSLNPRRKVGPMIARAAMLSGASRTEAVTRTKELLELVGLQSSAYDRRPAAFSGGQRQRIGIARALAMRPDVLIADESVSALDVSVQAQVLDLLADLQKRLSLAVVFITHDLRVAAQISDEIVVMSQGHVVERGPASQVLTRPQHPYTRDLIEAAPGRGAF